MVDFSIIIPTFNTKKTTAECVASVIRHIRAAETEIIVVDNASTDGTANYLRRLYPRIKVMVNPKNIGFGGACNTGANASRGRYLCFLNADTIWTENILHGITGRFAGGKIGLVAPQITDQSGRIQPSAGCFPTLGRLIAWTFFLDDLPVVKSTLAYHLTGLKAYRVARFFDWIQGACWIVPRDIYRETGGFDERYFMYAEDIDFCFRLRRLGYRCRYDPDLRLVHLDQGKVSSGRVIGEYQGLRRFMRLYRPAMPAGLIFALLQINAFIRFTIFGILVGDEDQKEAYRQALSPRRSS